MNQFEFSTTYNFNVFYQGHKLADKPKKRQVSIVLTMIAGFLIFSGYQKEPMDENMTYAGILTMIYIFIVRDLLLRFKIKNIWNKSEDGEVSKNYTFQENGVTINTDKSEDSNMPWSDFGRWQSNEEVLLLFLKNEPQNWLTIPLTALETDKSLLLKALVKDRMTKTTNIEE
jgi:hypothetical protein